MGSTGERIWTKAHHVAIIGAGPSGLAAAKYLLAERSFESVVIFEQRADVGGLWNYTTCPPEVLANLQVPQTKAHQGAEDAICEEDGTPAFLSPVYDRLETNIPRGLMGFSDLDWPEDCQLFPKHGAVLDYIKAYATDVKHLIKFNTQVVDVRLAKDSRWLVTTKDIRPRDSQASGQQVFDAVIVASGHFRVEYIPLIQGLEDWHNQYPLSVYHSKLYRRPEDFAGKKVLIVGNSASGIDIGAQIRQVCKKPLVQSSRSTSYLQTETPPDQTERPEIQRLIPAGRKAVFVDGSEERDIDVIVFCTGYMYNFPFLEGLQPELISTGERVQHLYKHIFYNPQPTLSFLVLNQKVIPFPVAEAQSAVIARFLSGRLSLPSQPDMEFWEQELILNTTRLRDFHLLKFPKDADYINELHDWAVNASPLSTRAEESVTAANQHASTVLQMGKPPPYWSDIDYWTREQFPAIKKAFQGLGEARHTKRSLLDVGFDYSASKTEPDRLK